MSKANLLGKRFGRLTVVAATGKNKHNNVLWMCRCECGGFATTTSAHLLSGHTKSCGCYGRTAAMTHGMSHTPEYQAYSDAKQRCTKQEHVEWKNYGARGIKFLFISFEQFYAELGARLRGMSLDRIDNNGHYEPGNVRWATLSQQNGNRRPSRSKLTLQQVEQIRLGIDLGKTQRELAKQFGVVQATISFIATDKTWVQKRGQVEKAA